MSTAILTVALGSIPTQVVVNGQEYIEAPAVASTPEPMPVILRAALKNRTGPASKFQAKKPDEYILVVGGLALGEKDTEHDGMPIITISTICNADKDQFINEAMFVGRFSKDGRAAEKSASRSVAVNRYVAGMLTPQKDAKGKIYTEVKCRRIRIHERTKGGAGTVNPAKDTSASGYEPSAFMGDDDPGDMPTSHSWK